MAGTAHARDRLISLIVTGFVVGAAIAAAGQARAQAQPCGGKLPPPDAVSEVGSDKFRLTLRQCPALVEPPRPHRAAQLDLYDRGSVTITMSDDDEPAPPVRQPAPNPAPVVPAPMPTKPTPGLRRDVQRIVQVAPAITAAAMAHGIDPLLLHAVAHVESRHDPRAVSPVGARGLMQVMPATAKRFGVKDEDKLFDAQTNLRASAAYLRNLRTRYGDNLPLVLAAYNAGEGAVDKYGGNVPPYPETQAYVRDVLAIYRRLTQQLGREGTHAGDRK